MDLELAEFEDRFESFFAYAWEVAEYFASVDATAADHFDLEHEAATKGRELARLAMQCHADLRAEREERVEVADENRLERGTLERDRRRKIETVVGEIDIARMAYRRRGESNRYPADGLLNLADESHSHGIRRLAAIEASRDSFEGAQEAIERASGVRVGTQQLRELAARSVIDFGAYYKQKHRDRDTAHDLVVLTADGKGVNMRPDALRKRAAESDDGKTGKKRMAEVVAVYDCASVVRTAADVFSTSDDKVDGPEAANVWVDVSLAEDTAVMITKLFDEATRRDPDHDRRWVALVDGNRHQIDRIESEATSRGVDVTIVLDIMHVREYLWDAAACFYPAAGPEAADWVDEKTTALLTGRHRRVPAAIRRKATMNGLTREGRADADRCAEYLDNHIDQIDYQQALADGTPIATGVIEGACRHLVKDRMDRTGARWSVQGGETILKIRALRANEDFDDYWTYHRKRERKRNHENRYAGGQIPIAQAA